MPRPQKQKIDLTPESFKGLLQNIYSEADEQRTKAIFQYNKWNRNVIDNNDISLLGKTNNELLKIIDGAINNKIQVARLIKDYMSSTTSSVASDSGSGVSNLDKDSLFELIEQASKANNVEYTASKGQETKNKEADDSIPF